MLLESGDFFVEEVFAKRLKISKLYDTYKNMLTDKQQRYMELYFDEDCSLTEIGEELGVSRQAVYDLLHRVENQLEKYEDKLHLCKIKD